MNNVDWILRIGDGINFNNSSKKNIWGIKSYIDCSKYFLKNIKEGDRLWFIQSKNKGKIIAMAIYKSHNKRIIGPLLDITLNNEELGWINNSENDWDIEIHYTDLYILYECDLYTEIKGAVTIREYSKKCKINLPLEYHNILKYSKIKYFK